MSLKEELKQEVNNFFDGKYEVVEGTVIPSVDDVQLGKHGKELELAMLFIDIRESTKITNGFRRETAAKMYKSFLWGIAKIARSNDGELRSFNGDGVLVVFIGDNKRTNAAKAALQMSWFCKEVIRPKLKTYFENNQQLQGFKFNFGIGIDVGKVLVVRGGIRGENNNDLVWVGDATNCAVKLSSLSNLNYNIYISEDVYKYMHKSSKLSSDEDMWEERVWNDMGGRTIYRSSWTWTPS